MALLMFCSLFQVKMWDLGSNQAIQVAAHDAPVKVVRWVKAPNYTALFSCSWDKTAKFWDTRSVQFCWSHMPQSVLKRETSSLSLKEAVRFWVQIPSSADLFSFLYHFPLGDASILKNFRQKVMLQFLAVWALMKNA